ncbi:MAG: hypothetical protein QE276_08310 [Cyanobium sp. D14.bin.5]|nr:hypothetical protein [Cyanobium sp. D14.bin.5]
MKNFPRLLVLLPFAAAFLTPAGEAQPRPNDLSCQFNKGKPIAASLADNGRAFTLKWADGPRQSYVWVGSNADMHNLTDSLGGKWHYSDHRNGRGFSLWNIDNRNRIDCD